MSKPVSFFLGLNSAAVREPHFFADKTSLTSTAWNFGAGYPPARASASRIIKVVSAAHGLTRDELLTKSAAFKFSRPRQVAMFLCREYLTLKGKQRSFPSMGSKFGKDHSTVLMGARRVEQRAAADPAFARFLNLLRYRINSETLQACPTPIFPVARFRCFTDAGIPAAPAHLTQSAARVRTPMGPPYMVRTVNGCRSDRARDGSPPRPKAAYPGAQQYSGATR